MKGGNMGIDEAPREQEPQPPSDRWRQWRAQAMQGLILLGAVMAGHPMRPWETGGSRPDDEERPQQEH